MGNIMESNTGILYFTHSKIHYVSGGNVVEDTVKGYDLNHSESSSLVGVGNVNDVGDNGSFMVDKGVRHMGIACRNWVSTIPPNLG